MYKRHRIELVVCWSVVTIIAFIYNWDFFEMASTAITIASIAIGVYIAAVSALLGSKYAEKLQQIADPEIKTKTFLGVLAHYFRYAGTGCMALIIISSIYCIPTEPIMPLAYRFVSAITYGLFAINLLFMWLILIFLVNSLGKSIIHE